MERGYEVVEKLNADFVGSKKEFWTFVGRRSKGKKRTIASLKNRARISVSSTMGKYQKHYEQLGKCR